MENPVTQVNGIKIYINNNSELIIKKNKTKRILSYILGLIISLVFIASPIIYIIYLNRFNTIKKDYIVWLLTAAILFFIGFCFFEIRRTVRNYKDFVIKNDKIVSLNGEDFCLIEHLNPIVIQTVYGANGIGRAYNIGIASGKLLKVIVANQTLEDASKIAGAISYFLNKRIEVRE